MARPAHSTPGHYAKTNGKSTVSLAIAAAPACDGGEGPLVEGLNQRIATLEQACLKARNDLVDSRAKTKRLEDERREDKAEIRRLKADLALSYSLNRDQECALKETGQKIISEQAISHSLCVKLLECIEEIRTLKAQLGRNSDNSSLPPSQSLNNNKKVVSSREKTGRRPGAQPGHAAHPRKKQTPDRTVTLSGSGACLDCGGLLIQTEDSKVRQQVDLKIIIETTDYVATEQVCTCCGKSHFPAFPEGIDDDVNYTSGVRALVTHLTSCCNVSIDNVSRFFYEATRHRLKLSKGFIHNSLARFSKMAAPAKEDIGQHIASSAVVHSDATFIRSAGREAYIYVYLDGNNRMFAASDTKGRRPLENSLLNGYEGTVVHDHDVSYYNYAKAHSECNVHVLRYLKGVCENEPKRTWAAKMHELLISANKETHFARKAGLDTLPQETIDSFIERYDKILELARVQYDRDGPFNVKYKPEGIKLSKRLEKYKENHLLFLRDLGVPFSNNLAEQALRASKKKMKQSGGFRSIEHGATYYCDVLTVTQTAAVRDMEMLGVIRSIFDGDDAVFKTATTESSPEDFRQSAASG